MEISREQAKKVASYLDLCSVREYAANHPDEYRCFISQLTGGSGKVPPPKPVNS